MVRARRRSTTAHRSDPAVRLRQMKAWRVDRRINNVWNDEPSLIDPVKEDALPEEPKRTEKSTRKSKTDESGQMGMFD
jgi:hypothetical protein